MSTARLFRSRSASITFKVSGFIFHTYVITLTDAVAFHSAHFGTGVGPIHLDNVACSGNENNLIDCSYSSFVTCSSGHHEDAGVRCQGRSLCVAV